MVFWFALLLFVGSTVLSALLQRRPKDVQPSSLGDFTFPTAQEGRVIPIVYGTVKISAPNVIWYGDLKVDPIKKKSGGFFGLFAKKVIVGYKYFVGMQMALCHGALNEIISLEADGDKDVPFTKVTIQAAGFDDYEQLTVTQPDLFGGEERDGGIEGVFDFYLGLETSVGNAYLGPQLGLAPAPAYRGLSHVVARRPYLGTSPFIKSLAWIVRRTPSALGEPVSVTNIFGDANPAEIIYDLMSNQIFGLGIAPARFDNASFVTVAQTLATEIMGMSMQIDNPASADQAIGEVLRHIDAVLFTDPESGLWTLELARFDYDPDTILHLTAADLIKAPEFTRGSWEETLNEIKIKYIDRSNNFKASFAQAQETANHATRSGEIASETINFLGFSNPVVAQTVAARELKGLSFPLGKWVLQVKRTAAQLRIGRPFKLTWDPLCIVGLVLRVTSIKGGRLEDGTVEIEAIEDIFAIGFTAYAPRAPSGWVDPIGDPAAPTAQLAVEAPYFLTLTDRFLLVAAVRSSGFDLGFEIWSDESSGFFESNVADAFAPSGLLEAAYLRSSAALDATGFTLELGQDLEVPVSTDAAGRVRGDNLLLVDDEWISWETVVDNGDGTFDFTNLVRGIFDSLPADHALGARVWFISNGSTPSKPDPYPADISGDIKCLPFNPRGTVAIAAVSPVAFTLVSRSLLPYPPGNVKINGVSWPDGGDLVGNAVLTWAHRDRIAQTTVIQQDAGDQGTLEGDYTIEVLIDSVVIPARTQTGVTGTTFTYLLVDRQADDADDTKLVQFRITPINGSLTGTIRLTDFFHMIP